MSIDSKNNNFDLLRLIAAIFVVFDHSINAVNIGNIGFAQHFKIGLSSIGVYMFFIISGFLVTQSRINNSRASFCWKRLLRIIPAYYVMTILATFLLGIVFTSLPLLSYFMNVETYKYLLRSITFFPIYTLPGVFNGNSVNASIWSLTFEVFCYSILFLVPKSFLIKKTIFLGCLFLFCCSLIFVNINATSKIFYYVLKTSQTSFLFFTGAALFYVINFIKKYKMAIALTSLIAYVLYHSYLLNNPYFEYISYLILAIFSISIAHIHLPLKLKSDYSYGIYLYGFPVQQCIKYSFTNYTFTPFIFFLIVLFITFLFAFFSWHYIEKYFIQLKNKF